VWRLTFFSNLLLDRKKDEYLCSFLEVVPRLVICHSLQPVIRCLLRLAAAVVIEPPLLSPLLFKIASLRTRFRVGVIKKRFADIFGDKFYFLPVITIDTYNSLPYMNFFV